MKSKNLLNAAYLIVAIALTLDHFASRVECKPPTIRRRRSDNGDQQKQMQQQHHHHHHHKHWGYRDEEKSVLPKEWHKTHPKCLGQQQSPINIETSTTHYEQGMQTIQIHKLSSDSHNDHNEEHDENNEANEHWKLENNGHTIKLTPLNAKFGFKLTPEDENYRLLQMHFHWRGSEHEVNHHKFSAELHLVHQSEEDKDKLAVIGFLFELSDTDNKNLAPIIYELSHLERFNSSSKSHAIKLEELLPVSVSKYYRYPGSLTTPGCDEIVQWIVIDTPVLTISENQLLQFQMLQDPTGYPMLSNSRPIQEVYERSIKRSFENIQLHSRIIAESANSYSEVGSHDHNGSFSVFRYSSLSILIFSILPIVFRRFFF